MTQYEKDIARAESLGLVVYDGCRFNSPAKGAVAERRIFISGDLKTSADKRSVLAEEVAHAFYNHGNILSQKNSAAQRQERLARRRGAEALVTLDMIIKAVDQLREEATAATIAEYLEVTPKDVKEAMRLHSLKHEGVLFAGSWAITFSPFRVWEKERYLNQ